VALLSHTSHEFEAELRQLKGRLFAMGGRCEQMIIWAVSALEEQNVQLAEDVMRADRQMNEDEMAVDEMAMRMLALRQPVGRDLRFAITAVKVVTDLERIGDEAVNLAERVAEMVEHNDAILPSSDIPQIAELAAAMLHDALDAFVEEDAERAIEVLAKDDAVDEIYGRMLRTSVEYMKTESDHIAAGMRVSSSAKYIERIADHATNIAEMVVYLVRGEDVRHRGSL
jgi:phosphate transport system protein